MRLSKPSTPADWQRQVPKKACLMTKAIRSLSILNEAGIPFIRVFPRQDKKTELNESFVRLGFVNPDRRCP